MLIQPSNYADKGEMWEKKLQAHIHCLQSPGVKAVISFLLQIEIVSAGLQLWEWTEINTAVAGAIRYYFTQAKYKSGPPVLSAMI